MTSLFQTLTVKMEVKVFLPLLTLLNHAVADRAVGRVDSESLPVVVLWTKSLVVHVYYFCDLKFTMFTMFTENKLCLLYHRGCKSFEVAPSNFWWYLKGTDLLPLLLIYESFLTHYTVHVASSLRLRLQSSPARKVWVSCSHLGVCTYPQDHSSCWI